MALKKQTTRCEAIGCTDPDTRSYIIVGNDHTGTLSHIKAPFCMCKRHAQLFAIYCDLHNVAMVRVKEDQ